MVRSGSRASCRNTAVASKPMKQSAAHMMPVAGDPWSNACVGDSGLKLTPSAPPWTRIATPRRPTTAASRTSRTDSTLELSSMSR